MIDQLYDVLKKKALRFSYTEEVKEYELKTPKPLIYCEKKHRLYSKSGFVKVKPVIKNDQIISLKIPKKCPKFGKTLKKLEFFANS